MNSKKGTFKVPFLFFTSRIFLISALHYVKAQQQTY